MGVGRSGSRHLLVLIVLVLSLVLGTESRNRRNRRVRVWTKYGPVYGIQRRWTQRFLGIPYASPPERWQDPQELTRFSQRPLRAYSFKPACPQTFCEGSYPDIACSKTMSENCLYLNIFSPRNAHRRGYRRAVMIFIHGGSFRRGTASAKFYNGAALARRGVIVVTFNYRLGVLGFLVTGSGITGNYGMKDQRMAIKWVHDNIHKFGGDPNRITLVGQSAGAVCILLHSASGKVDDMFRSSIMQSAPLGVRLESTAVSAIQGAGLAALLTCSVNDIACLKTKSVDEILAAQTESEKKGAKWFPSFDGDEVKLSSVDAITTGNIATKPLIIGSTAEEGEYFVPFSFPQPVNDLFLQAYLTKTFPNRVQKLATAYIPANPADVRPELAQIQTDYAFTCSSFFVARKMLAKTPAVYTYFFKATVVDEFWNKLGYCKGRVCHNVDLPYIFPSVYARSRVFTRSELQLSRKVITYWTNFVKFGNPNQRYRYPWRNRRLLYWPKYNTQTKISLLFDLTQLTSLKPKVRDAFCQIWDEGPYAPPPLTPP